MNSWIVIITFIYPHEAHLAKGILEVEGFDVLIRDEMTVQVNNFYSTAIGGVKLLVRQSDAERAYVALKEAGFIKEEEKNKNEKLEYHPKQYACICPYCESDNVNRKKIPGYIILFSLLLLGFPLSFLKKTYYCFDCKKEWKVKYNTINIVLPG